MKETSNQSGKAAKVMGFLGLGLCALCCTLPIIGIISGAGVLATIALYAEKAAVIFSLPFGFTEGDKNRLPVSLIAPAKMSEKLVLQ